MNKSSSILSTLFAVIFYANIRVLNKSKYTFVPIKTRCSKKGFMSYACYIVVLKLCKGHQ